MKKDILITGKTSDIKGIDPKIINSFPAMPNLSRMEYTVSIYATIAPNIINNHAASLIFGQRKIAMKAANAPNINWLEIKMV
ncbi:MAG: hypothetical protein FWC21_05600 [Treponema sp.]|nr:hypothetical protein [Treponema sp.]